jgi:predicted nucleic acid-binding protein
MTPAPPAVFADASVLYSALLRDMLIQAALEKAFTLRWSAEVQVEWRQALLANRPDLAEARILRTQRLLEAALPSAAISGFHARVAGLILPDPDDRHVLAAAIHGGCEIIVTHNLADFPASALAPYNITAMHPDAFFAQVLEDAPLPLIKAMRTLRLRLKSPAYSKEEFLSLLIRHGLPSTAEDLKPALRLI